MTSVNQLWLSKSAARGDQMVKLLQRLPAGHVPEDLQRFARLPNPMARPPMIPVTDEQRLRTAWQPMLARTAPNPLHQTVLTGRPEPYNHSESWFNQMQRRALAQRVAPLRKTAGVGQLAFRALQRATGPAEAVISPLLRRFAAKPYPGLYADALADVRNPMAQAERPMIAQTLRNLRRVSRGGMLSTPQPYATPPHVTPK